MEMAQLGDGSIVAVLMPTEACRVMAAYRDQVRAEPKAFADPREAHRRLKVLVALLRDKPRRCRHCGGPMAVPGYEAFFGSDMIYVRWALGP
jgi:hypothetical protein